MGRAREKDVHVEVQRRGMKRVSGRRMGKSGGEKGGETRSCHKGDEFLIERPRKVNQQKRGGGGKK